MFKEFRVSNFKSIQKEQTFTLEACPKKIVSEFPDHVIEIGGERLLKVTSIYGPNGGGKSNLLKALNIFSLIIFQHTLFNDSIKNENYFPNLYSKDKYTSFTLFIIRDGFEIGYSLKLDLNNMVQVVNPTSSFIAQFVWAIDVGIISEEMICRRLDEKEFATMFSRDKDGLVSSDLFDNIDLIKNNRALSKNQTFLKYFNDTFGNSAGVENAVPIFAFYKELSSYIWARRESRTFNFPKNMVDFLTPCLQKAKELLNSLDMRITDINFKLKEPGLYFLYIERKTKDGKTVSIPLNNESAGTIKTVNMILDILSSQEECVCIADDFDAHLHPKLIKAIVELFASKENKKRQLIYNSHDITNMSNKLFRRDEIWFAYRDDDYSTQYVPLSSIVNYKGEMVRKDAVYSKQYLEGRYGADPFIKKGLGWCND